MHWLGYIVLIGLPLFAALFLFDTASKWLREYSDKVLRCSVETKAQIVGVEKERVPDKADGSSSTWLHPVVQFALRDKEFKVRCEERANPLPFELGDRISVWYNPEDPSDIHLEGKYSGKTMGYTVPMVGALLFGAIAVGCAVFCIRYTF